MLTPIPQVTSPVSYTATYSSLTNATAVTKWSRQYKFMIIDLQVRWTGAGGAGAFTVDLPAGFLIDTSALPGGTGTSNQEASKLGDAGYWFDQGNGWLFVWPKFNTTSRVGFVVNTQVLDGGQFANGDSLNMTIRVPIVGW